MHTVFAAVFGSQLPISAPIRATAAATVRSSLAGSDRHDGSGRALFAHFSQYQTKNGHELRFFAFELHQMIVMRN